MEEKGSKRFGSYLRKLREERRLTLDTIEDLSQSHSDRISRTYLSRCENGRTLPSFTKLFTLSKIYRTRLTALAERLQLDVELESMPPVDLTATGYEELTRRGQDEVRQGNVKAAFLLFNAAWDSASLQEDESRRAQHGSEARLALAIALYRLGRLEMAEEECKGLLSQAGLAPVVGRRTLILLSAIYYDTTRNELARIMIHEAEARLNGIASQPAGAPGIPVEDAKSFADILSMKGLLELESGRFDEARAAFEKARERYEALEDAFSLCKTFGNLGAVAARAGQERHALAHFQHSLDMARQQGYPYYAAKRLHDIGRLHYDRGRLGEARRSLHDSNELARRGEFHDVTFLNCFYLWKSALAEGDRAAAMANDKSLRFFAFKIENSFPELEEFKAHLETRKGDEPCPPRDVW
jgi:tetratricopeptide (TPR) repeat protein